MLKQDWQYLEILLFIYISTFHINKQKTGCLFISYPNSEDKKLYETDPIKINDLISIENTIFSQNLNFKVLNFPNVL